MFNRPQQITRGPCSSPPSKTADHSTLKSEPRDPNHSPATTSPHLDTAYSRKGKYTGCNCSKSQCLKMYCACFSVGRMCDEVLPSLYRPVSAKLAKIVVITWTDPKQFAR